MRGRPGPKCPVLDEFLAKIHKVHTALVTCEEFVCSVSYDICCAGFSITWVKTYQVRFFELLGKNIKCLASKSQSHRLGVTSELSQLRSELKTMLTSLAAGNWGLKPWPEILAQERMEQLQAWFLCVPNTSS